MREAGQGGATICRTSSAMPTGPWRKWWRTTRCNGCNLQPGDLFGSGTLSGPTPGQAGSLMELTAGGKEPLHAAQRRERAFLQDGDAVVLRG